MYYVYEMRHVPSGRVYVGQRRLPKGETPETDKYYGSGKIWKRIYKAHPDECAKTVLEVVESKEEANELEKKWIARYRELYGDKCVNITDGGEGWSGVRHSEATRKKMSLSHRGKPSCNKGKKMSEESRRKMSESHKNKPSWNKGKKCPQFSERQLGEKNHMFGKHHSEEARKKLSEALKGKPHSEEHNKKVSEALKGRTGWRKGKQHSEDAKQKISESLKLYHARRKEKNHE